MRKHLFVGAFLIHIKSVWKHRVCFMLKALSPWKCVGAILTFPEKCVILLSAEIALELKKCRSSTQE